MAIPNLTKIMYHGWGMKPKIVSFPNHSVLTVWQTPTVDQDQHYYSNVVKNASWLYDLDHFKIAYHNAIKNMTFEFNSSSKDTVQKEWSSYVYINEKGYDTEVQATIMVKDNDLLVSCGGAFMYSNKFIPAVGTTLFLENGGVWRRLRSALHQCLGGVAKCL